MALKRRPPERNVRRVKTNSKNTWGVTTNQIGDTVQFESDNEKVLLLTMLRNREVKEVISQPRTIKYKDENGKKHSYTPDFEVHFHDGRVEIHEFSMAKKRLEKSIRDREAAAKIFCAERGWKYIVHTENDLPCKTEVANIKALRGYRPSSYCDKTIAQSINEVLANEKPILIETLANQVSSKLGVPRPLVLNTIYHKMWHRQLSFDPKTLLFIDGTPNPQALTWKGG